MADPQPMSREEAVQFIKDVGERVKLLETRSEGDVERFASHEDVQATVDKALQAITEESDRKVAEAEARNRSHGDDYGLSQYITKGSNGEPAVQFLGGIDKGEKDYRPGLLDDTETHGEWHRQFKSAVNDLNVIRLWQRNPDRPDQKADHPATTRRINRLMDGAPDAIRKIFADTSGSGGEWIPTDTLPTYEEDMRLTRRLEALFPILPMSNKTVELPYKSSGMRPYIKGAVTTDDPAQYTTSKIGTANRTFNAVGFAVRGQVDEDASEDSIIAFAPLHRSEAVMALNDGFEDIILNGDSTATHQDTIDAWDIDSRWGTAGLGTSADHRRADIGLRARANDVSNTTDQGSDQTFAGFLVARGKLASGYAASSDLVCIPSYYYYIKKMIGFAEVITVDKYGPQATVITGEIAKIGGVSIIHSPFMSNEMNTSGVYDDSTKTKGGMILVPVSRFIVGIRRGGVLETAKDITRGIHNLVYTARKTFATLDSSSKKNVHYSFNLTATS